MERELLVQMLYEAAWAKGENRFADALRLYLQILEEDDPYPSPAVVTEIVILGRSGDRAMATRALCTAAARARDAGYTFAARYTYNAALRVDPDCTDAIAAVAAIDAERASAPRAPKEIPTQLAEADRLETVVAPPDPSWVAEATRALRFPEEASICYGSVSIRRPGHEPWHPVGKPSGTVMVPADAEVRLQIDNEDEIEAGEHLQHLAWNDLTELDLSYARSTDEDLQVIKQLTGLRGLGLEASDQACSGALDLPFGVTQYRLHLEGSQGYGVTSAGLRALEHHRQLEWLHLSTSGIDDDAVDVLVQLPELRRLRLAHSGVTGAALPHLARMGLNVLSLQATAVTSADLAGLAGSSLRELDLAGCDLTGGVGALAQLPALQKLRLFSSGAPIATLAGCNTLTTLLAAICRIDRVDADVLVRLPALRDIEVTPSTCDPDALDILRAQGITVIDYR